jgi:hypothetical protein
MGMSTYTPDVWVVLEFDAPQLEQPLRKVFAGWYGGYTGSDSWKLNSGITEVRVDDEGHYEFDGYSGSTYCCHVNNYKMSGLMYNVLGNWLKQAEQRGDTSIKILTLDEIV